MIKNYFQKSTPVILSAKIILLVIALLSVVITISPTARKTFKNTFLKNNQRTILSTVSGDVFNNGKLIKVVKVKEQNKILLEIYDYPEMGARKLLDQIILRDYLDGYIQSGLETLNLALKDMDGDQILEIIAPSFDSDMNPHVNIFRYNSSIERFEEDLSHQ